jgi:hypothetical protein
MKLEELFDKALVGATIEKLDSDGNWLPKETVRYKNRHSFIVSDNYVTLKPFDTIRLTLTRNLVIDWSVSFLSHRGLVEIEKEFEHGFDWEKALFLAQLSVLVYEDEEEIEENIERYYNFDDFYFFSKKSHRQLFKKALKKILLIIFRGKKSIVDLQFMTLLKVNEEKNQKTVTIIFRGSNELGDWMTNLRAKDENFYNRGYVHQGFRHASNLFLKTVRQKGELSQHIPEVLENNTNIILTGHSLGGTMATLIGCHLLERGVKKENLEVYTFGTPPIGDENFCNYYQDKLHLHRLVNENDIVAHLDKWFHLKHFGEEIILPSNQGEVHSGEGYIDNIIDRMEESRN